jgi:hypothetical protein
MIKIAVEVRSSATRFKVALLAESIEGALEMANRYNPGKECKVCSLSTQRSSSSDEAAWYGSCAFCYLQHTIGATMNGR